MLNSSSEDKRVWFLIGTMTVLGMLFIPFSQMFLGIEYDYTLRTVALGGIILGIVSGVLGCFAVLRRESLIGDALSHAALPGVCIAFLVVGRDLGGLLIGAGIASWLGVYFINLVTRTTRIKQDAAMGIVLAAWFAAGIALLTYIQGRADASQAGLNTFIFGQAAAIVAQDVGLISGVGLVAFIILALFWKEFKLITFDAGFAVANGLRLQFFNLLLSTLIVVAVVLGLQLAGVILMVGMLIAPGIAARQWTHKLNQMIILAAVFGAFAGGTGAILSAFDRNLPTGPMIIIMAFLIVLFSMSFAPDRGLIWSSLRRRADRHRFATLHVLRDIYKYACNHGEANYPVPHSFLIGVRGGITQIGLSNLQRQMLIEKKGDMWLLTAKGIQTATDDQHNQKLWDIYRQYSDTLGLPMIPEDRQIDIHKSLSPTHITQLEQKLNKVTI